MTNVSVHGDRIPTPEPVVCLDADDKPMPRVSKADAEILCQRGWAEWRGKGSRRHLRLTAAAPLRQFSPLRGDGTGPCAPIIPVSTTGMGNRWAIQTLSENTRPAETK